RRLARGGADQVLRSIERDRRQAGGDGEVLVRHVVEFRVAGVEGEDRPPRPPPPPAGRGRRPGARGRPAAATSAPGWARARGSRPAGFPGRGGRPGATAPRLASPPAAAPPAPRGGGPRPAGPKTP